MFCPMSNGTLSTPAATGTTVNTYNLLHLIPAAA